MRKLQKFLALLLVVCMLFSLMTVAVSAVEISTKPTNGNTVGQPFAPYTGGSQNFRIPGIVTLDNGTLIAACDARWNHNGDGAGLDTIVSVSTDNGANWTYTYANYLGDNGDTYNNLSTCFIDPGIGTDGTTAYLIADLWPAGIALNTSKYNPVSGKTGFDDNDNLQLRDVALDTVVIGGDRYQYMAAAATYGYYLDLDTLELYAYGAEGEEDVKVEGYTVDPYFNIVSEDGEVDTNLFFSDSPYQPYPTDYLYMTTSTDGLNWSEPELLNLKEASEQTLLVGPGNGTYSEVYDHMIFTAYEHSSGYERASLIWMDAEGNWTRTEDATVDSWSSEATSVVLDDGTVRMFYRDGSTALRYTDYVWSEAENNYVRAATEVNTTAIVDSGCQLTSIKYSGQIEGKDVILVAGPTSSRRINGYIYTFLVNEDNAMELAYAYNITPNFYAYSCMTEMANGDIALLWESNNSALTFSTFKMSDLTARNQDVRLNFKKIEMLTGDTKTVVDNTGYYPGADLSVLNPNIATVELSGSEIATDAAQLGSNANYAGDIINTSDCVYTFAYDEETGRWSASSTDASGDPVYLYPGNTRSSGYPNRSAEYANLSIFAGYEDGTFCIMSNDCDNANQSTSYLYFDRGSLKWDRVSAPGSNNTWQTNVSLMLYRPVEGAGSAELPGYQRVTDMAYLSDGEYLVVGPGSNGNLYALYPNTATTDRYCQIAKILDRTVVGETRLVFTAIGPGYTEVQVGSTVYMITVADMNEINVTVPVGQSITVTEPNGNYADADTSALNTSVATVNLEGVNGTTEITFTGVYPGTASVDIGRTKYIVTVTGELLDVTIGDEQPVSYMVPGTLDDVDLSKLDESIATVELTKTVAGFVGIGADYTGGMRALEEMLYTFTATDDGYFEVSGVTADGTVIYLNHYSTAISQIPNSETPGKIDVRSSSYENMFKLVAKSLDGASADRGLHFHTEKEFPHWNRCGNDTSAQCHEYLYRPAQENETSSNELPCYVLVTDISEIVDGGKYLIAHRDEAGHLYVLNPCADKDSWFTHVAYIDDAVNVTIIGVDDGNTIARVGTTVFEITVSTCEHVYEAVVTEPTCTESGYTTYTCSNCGHTYRGDEVAVTEHSDSEPIEENENAASCGANGSYDSVVYCKTCGVEVSRETVVVPATGDHNYESEIGGVEATCTADGHVIKACVCGATVTTVLPAFGHDYDELLTAPNCEIGGSTTYTCKICRYSYVADEVAALGHSYNAVVTAPDCLNGGYTTYTCGTCGDSYVADEVAALGHAYEAVVTAPTCTAAGYTTYTCACGDSYVADEVAALGHSYNAVVTAPDCLNGGYTTYTCGTCGDSYVADEVAALGHNVVLVESEDATCELNGYEYYACDRCGGQEYTVILEAKDHSYVNGKCEHCGEADPNAKPSVPSKPSWGNWFDKWFGSWWDKEECKHTYTVVVTAPTCTEQGYTTHTCSKCKDSYKDTYTNALGHTWDEGKVTKKATCTKDGVKTYTCENCGQTKTETIKAHGHQYKNGICQHCGVKIVIKPVWGNIWGWIGGWWK